MSQPGRVQLNHANRDVDSESYHELHEGNMYDVRVGRNSARREECLPGEVYVTQEYRVEEPYISSLLAQQVFELGAKQKIVMFRLPSAGTRWCKMSWHPR